MPRFWLFLLIVAVAIAWFLFDKPVLPGERLDGKVISVKPLPQISGPPGAEVTVALPDGRTVQIKADYAHVLAPGQQVDVMRMRRRITGVESFELPIRK